MINILISVSPVLFVRDETMKNETEYIKKELEYEMDTILIVEDDELYREMLGETLEGEHRVIYADNGKVGLELLRQNYERIEVVLLDIQMPVMNGFEFLEAVNQDKVLSSIPVIVLTVKEQYDDEEKCFDLGASDFICKPSRPQIVKRRVNNIIKIKDSAATLYKVEYDTLTGVYTRQAFVHYAEQLLKKNPDTRYDLIISDIENFRIINERYGTQVGDRILREIGNTLSGGECEGRVTGRYEVDRFVAIVPYSGVDLDLSLEEMCHHIIKNLALPNVRSRFGIYEDIPHDMPITISCDRAMMALKSAKQNLDSVYAKFDSVLLKKITVQQRIEHSMKEALKEKQFRVYYQPKHDAITGKLIGAEALVRWMHPEYGFMSPADFIPLFEQNGFITELDFYVWQRTCENIHRWINQGINAVPISVNASKLDFQKKDFLKKIQDVVDANELPSNMLHIEVTESLFADRIDELSLILNQCREKGYQIELDDFGTGYSSLNTLGTLPLDVVKLDMSFMNQLHDKRRLRVLTACVQLARSLNLKITSEGVETEEQLHMLRKLGVDTIQGYFFSKPLPENEFEEYLKKQAG